MMEDEYQSDESMPDSDVELQEAFARGDLKPGLVVLEKHTESTTKKPITYNNVPRLKTILEQIRLPSSFDWVERLDVISDLAPLAPEIAVQLDEHREKREKEIKHVNAMKKKKKQKSPSATPTLKSIEEDPIHNDFQRELNFHRQAQSAIMTCLPKLHKLGVPTKRPEDYFAEMAKSDEHMQKIASVLLKKQTATEKAEKVRKMRDQKKIAKQTQVHVMQERQKAKKELIDSVKKYRKGQKNSLDFLEEKRSSRGGRGGGGVNRKRELKNERYGYGGKKSGFKRNTRDSLDNVPSRGFRGGGGGRGGSRGFRGGGRGGGANTGRGGGRPGNSVPIRSGRGRAAKGTAKRPGKSNRMKARAGKP